MTANHSKKPALLILILLIGFPSVATVLITPAFPAISKAFALSTSLTQWLIFLFIIGYALGQIVYAPIANRFGRKPAIYTGLTIYFLSIGLCFIGVHYHSFSLILIGRFFMALGAAVGMIISFTLINDTYTPQEARGITAYTVLAYAFMPAVGIFIGGWVTHLFSWIACFDTYIVIGLIIAIATCFLPETLDPAHKKPIHPTHIFERYAAGFKNRQLVIFSIIYGLMAGYIYITASAAPFIGIDTIGLTAAAYGSIILLPYLGQVVGGVFAGRFGHRFTPYKTMAIGYALTIFGSLLMFITFSFNIINVYTLVIPLFFVMMGLPIVYSNTTMMALKDFSDKATGSAVMSFITMTFAFLASILLIFIPSKDALTMPILFLIVAALAVGAFWDASRRYSDQ